MHHIVAVHIKRWIQIPLLAHFFRWLYRKTLAKLFPNGLRLIKTCAKIHRKLRAKKSDSKETTTSSSTISFVDQNFRVRDREKKKRKKALSNGVWIKLFEFERINWIWLRKKQIAGIAISSWHVPNLNSHYAYCIHRGIYCATHKNGILNLHACTNIVHREKTLRRKDYGHAFQTENFVHFQVKTSFGKFKAKKRLAGTILTSTKRSVANPFAHRILYGWTSGPVAQLHSNPCMWTVKITKLHIS